MRCDVVEIVREIFECFFSECLNAVEQAALVITGAWQGPNRSKLYDELGWESLSHRRWCRRILNIHKILCNQTPPYLKTVSTSQTFVQSKL